MLFTKTEHTQVNCANNFRSLHQQGYAVIPLNGKRPSFSLKWKRYQTTLPDAETVSSWIRQSFQSYGIICGQVSGGLLVIDFDEPELYRRFQRRFPGLRDTYTVATRRGFHVYLRTTFPVAGKRLRACDIKADGGYVVGPGSQVDGYTYHEHIRKDVLTLAYGKYRELLQWLAPQSPSFATATDSALPEQDPVAAYHRLAAEQGRNNALYAVARDLYRLKFPLKQAIASLSLVHAAAKANGPHPAENLTERLAEARRTIRSAYQSGEAGFSAEPGLPNSVREALLQRQKSSIAARLLDGIQRFGQPGGYATGKRILEIAERCRLAKKSVMRLLSGDLAKLAGKRLFKRFNIETIASYDDKGDSRKPNVKRGRKPRFIYRLPGNKYLQTILQCNSSPSDSLQARDLCSGVAYRQALHRELIRRLSQTLSVSSLAARLGLSRRTIFRYNVALGVVATPMVARERLTAAKIQLLPDPQENERHFTPGLWLQTKAGKRFPAIRSLAEGFLRLGIDICKQLPSRYSLPSAIVRDLEPVRLPEHLRGRAKPLRYDRVHELLPPDWATAKYTLGGYLAVYDGHRWTFRPPLRAIAYTLTKLYEDGLVYYIKPLKVL